MLSWLSRSHADTPPYVIADNCGATYRQLVTAGLWSWWPFLLATAIMLCLAIGAMARRRAPASASSGGTALPASMLLTGLVISAGFSGAAIVMVIDNANWRTSRPCYAPRSDWVYPLDGSLPHPAKPSPSAS